MKTYYRILIAASVWVCFEFSTSKEIGKNPNHGFLSSPVRLVVPYMKQSFWHLSVSLAPVHVNDFDVESVERKTFNRWLMLSQTQDVTMQLNQTGSTCSQHSAQANVLVHFLLRFHINKIMTWISKQRWKCYNYDWTYLSIYTVGHKKKPTYFCLQLRQKSTEFSRLHFKMNCTWWYEFTHLT